MKRPRQEVIIAELSLSQADEYSSLVDDAVQLLSREAYKGSLSPRQVHIGVRAGRLLVAVNETHHVIGAGVLRQNSREKSAIITGIAVAEGHRGEGIGTQIISGLEEIAASNQIKTMYIDPNNDDAARLYGRLGYREPPNSDLLILEKTLHSKSG